jgi:hypothetical protein
MRNRVFLVAVAALAIAGSWTTVSEASVITFAETQFDTDWTSAAVGGMRTQGTGTIELTGVSGTVTRAYLYWHGPTNSTDPAANASVTFAGTGITGTNIGFSDDNFWGFENSQAYRADVTSLVSGNGTYALEDFRVPGVADINGASLVVYFDDGDDTNNRDVVTFHGNDANFGNPFDPDGWFALLNNINYTSGTVSVLFGVSDGQDFGVSDDPVAFLNGVPLYAATAGPFDGEGNGVGNAGSGVPSNGLLWDLDSFDITALMSPGDNDFTLTTGPSPSDALSLIHLHFDLPAGAAPPDPSAVPEPSSMVIMGVGALSLLGLRIRRRKAAKAVA